MIKQTTVSILLFILAFAMYTTAKKCEDRIAAKTCQYFIKIYGRKNIDVCKWKHMRSNCALTCKLCVPRPKCATSQSRYGCCWDKKTEAKSYAGEGCPECKDRYPNYCRQRVKRFSKEKACNERGNEMCPKSCGVCKIKAAAQALPECLNSLYGCCWDHTAALGPGGEGCRVCANLYTRLCSLWNKYCQPQAYKFVKESVIDRYRYSCPVTCGKCKMGQKKLDISSLRRL
ncbi:uncharacterized protein LOC111335432 [Stylophora pistillata]|uniref:uncharacterized protein LOC111335432 n=1 Tax=Stylophora pistillata TaxID=50429 RepID=UPI000C04A4B8|nr:uncharacterized protein LOC111335432 [Stylophora pistillata]